MSLFMGEKLQYINKLCSFILYQVVPSRSMILSRCVQASRAAYI